MSSFEYMVLTALKILLLWVHSTQKTDVNTQIEIITWKQRLEEWIEDGHFPPKVNIP